MTPNSSPFMAGLTSGGVNEDFEDQRAQLQGVAVREGLIADDELAVDEGAVAAAEVADQGVFVGDLEQAMLPANQGAVGLDVAFGASAEDEFAGGKGEAMPFGIALDDFQVHLHPESFQD